VGIGDDLVWLGDAYNLHTATQQQIKPTRRRRPLQIKPLWNNEPYISTQGTVELDELVPHKSDWLRPYAVNNPDYMPTAIPVTLTPEELELTYKLREQEPYCILCVDTKETTHSTNKSWPKEYYEGLAELLPLKCIRLQHNSDDTQYKNIENVVVKSERESYCYVRSAALVITTDGFLHHASASANTKCAVIWTVTSFAQLGYRGQLNIYDKSHLGCYTYREQCAKCSEILRKITPETVVEQLKRVGWIIEER
jgi:ADP-heptose:LPS heptosyltransferase